MWKGYERNCNNRTTNWILHIEINNVENGSSNILKQQKQKYINI